MHFKRSTFLTFSWLVGFYLFISQGLCSEISKQNTQAAPSPVALFSLVSDPESYDGRLIIVVGYYVREFEMSSIFATKDAANVGDIASSVWVTLENGKFKNGTPVRRGFVRLTGTFHAGPNARFGHLGVWNRVIDNVISVESLNAAKDPSFIIDCAFTFVAMCSLFYALLAKSSLNALIPIVVVCILWVGCSFLSLVLVLHEIPHESFSGVIGPVVWVTVAIIVRKAKLLFWRTGKVEGPAKDRFLS